MSGSKKKLTRRDSLKALGAVAAGAIAFPAAAGLDLGPSSGTLSTKETEEPARNGLHLQEAFQLDKPIELKPLKTYPVRPYEIRFTEKDGGLRADVKFSVSSPYKPGAPIRIRFKLKLLGSKGESMGEAQAVATEKDITVTSANSGHAYLQVCRGRVLLSFAGVTPEKVRRFEVHYVEI